MKMSGKAFLWVVGAVLTALILSVIVMYYWDKFNNKAKAQVTQPADAQPATT